MGVSSVGIGVGVGTEPLVNAGVQATPTEERVVPSLASAALSECDAARIAAFLKKLREVGGAADAETVDALIKLLGDLPPPEGPQILMNAIKHEQPTLFARLVESMRRTKQRKQGPDRNTGQAAS